ncbi:caspase family protein [Bradyrhizobium manausense]|uniref:caspase family protein n=1 Tax=Bradyrhizobium manausense TaxID=989370 RepID=UPI001BAC987E|nr:caspase family protein [Bradyrhizobium manausense]MBR1088284.1 caspase family protein [Bradyrhizobium manausense]
MRRPALIHLILASGLLALTQLLTPSEAAAEARLALVIGQSAYRTVPELPNAANDAKGMAELLGNAGFTVTTAPNLAQNEMRQAISDFAGKVSASGADTVALVFYAGHGLQIDGENYLVPVDLDPKREADIPLQGVRLNDLLNTLGALPTRARIFMLDACRNNPFPALSGAGHGLAIVDTKAGAPGSFISYSTSPGAEAEDGSGADSPYTTAALTVAKQPNLPIEEVFKRIRISVAQSTDGRQIPWESSSLTTDFKFFGAESNNSQPAAPGANSMALAGATRSVEDWRKDLQGKDAKVAYDLVIADDTVPAYQAYIELYAQDVHTPRLRTVMERRRQMLAWDRAVAINTRASFEAYLANWDNSDLAATARRLLLRVQNRNYTLPVASVAAPVAVAMAPTCPCSTPTPPATTPINPTVAPIIKKRVDDTPPPSKRKVVDTPPKRKSPPDEVVVERAPPPGPPPGAVMQGIGIGVGIGIGMGMGGHGGGMGRGDGDRGRY